MEATDRAELCSGELLREDIRSNHANGFQCLWGIQKTGNSFAVSQARMKTNNPLAENNLQSQRFVHPLFGDVSRRTAGGIAACRSPRLVWLSDSALDEPADLLEQYTGQKHDRFITETPGQYFQLANSV